jgi:hypothetical protein
LGYAPAIFSGWCTYVFHLGLRTLKFCCLRFTHLPLVGYHPLFNSGPLPFILFGFTHPQFYVWVYVPLICCFLFTHPRLVGLPPVIPLWNTVRYLIQVYAPAIYCLGPYTLNLAALLHTLSLFGSYPSLF